MSLFNHFHIDPTATCAKCAPTAPAVSGLGEHTLPMDSPAPLDASHRCDRCSAAAQVSVISPKGNLLLFCKHHFEANALELMAQGFTIVQDNRPALV